MDTHYLVTPWILHYTDLYCIETIPHYVLEKEVALYYIVILTEPSTHLILVMSGT